MPTETETPAGANVPTQGTKSKAHIAFLVKLGACTEAVEFADNFPTANAAWNACTRSNWLWWLLRQTNSVTKEQSVAYAIDCAERALPIFTAIYPNDDRPAKAIEAAKSWLKVPNAAYAAYAADAAYAAANAADAAYAAANAAANADAYAAANAAYAAANAADAAYAAYAAANAANAAYAAANAAANADARSKEIEKQCDYIRAHFKQPNVK